MRAILFTVCRQLFQQRQLSLRHRLGSWPRISGYGQRMERLGRHRPIWTVIRSDPLSDRFHMVTKHLIRISAGNVLMDCTMDEGEPEYTVSYRYYEQTGYFQKNNININSYNEGKNRTFRQADVPRNIFADIPTATPNCRLDSYPFCRRPAHAVRAEARRYGSEQGTCPPHFGPWPILPKPSSRTGQNLHSSPSAGGISFAGRVLRLRKPVTYSTNRPGSI